MKPLTSIHTTEAVVISAADRLRTALEALIEENHQLRAVIAAMQAPAVPFGRNAPAVPFGRNAPAWDNRPIEPQGWPDGLDIDPITNKIRP